jgi:heme-degrading monooxygenase HmoA
MYARTERINLSQGFAELAEQLADRIAPIMRRQPGMQAMTLLSDESSGEYIVLTHWDTLEQVNAYERSPDEWRVRDIMSQHLTAVPLIEVYQVHTLPAAPAEPTASAAAGTA